jgi:hypothetical protein
LELAKGFTQNCLTRKKIDQSIVRHSWDAKIERGQVFERGHFSAEALLRPVATQRFQVDALGQVLDPVTCETVFDPQ